MICTHARHTLKTILIWLTTNIQLSSGMMNLILYYVYWVVTMRSCIVCLWHVTTENCTSNTNVRKVSMKNVEWVMKILIHFHLMMKNNARKNETKRIPISISTIFLYQTKITNAQVFLFHFLALSMNCEHKIRELFMFCFYKPCCHVL